MSETIVSFILGIISGAISPILYWTYKNHISLPKIEFSENITKNIYDDSSIGFIYIWKNTGKRRIIDISVEANIKIPGLVKYNPNLKQIISFETKAQKKFVTEVGKARSSRLIVDEYSLKRNKILVNHLKIRIDSEINIETLFELSPDAEITINILGNDEKTGIRKVFESPIYTKESIIEGVFNRETLYVENPIRSAE